MNDDSKLTVPNGARVSKASTKRTLLLVGLLSLVAFTIFTRVMYALASDINNRNNVHGADGVYPLILLGVLVVGIAGGLLWWRKFWHVMDEAAQRAHLDAFFWGGNIAWMVIVPFAILPLKVSGFEFAFITKLDMNTSEVFGLGMFATMVATTIGYGVAWLIWWAKRL